MKTQAIIPTAGLGTRLKASAPKPLVLINDKPIFVHTLEVFEQCDHIDNVILVVCEDLLSEIEKEVQQYKLNKVSRIVAGGQTRSESVYNGLNVTDKDTDIVLIHDGARPLITKELIQKAINLCEHEEAVVLGIPVAPTIKRVNDEDLSVKETLDRKDLWEIQTPQVFKRELLIQGYKEAQGNHFTDDAALVEQLGIKIKILQGDHKNIKITTQEDLVIAEAFLNQYTAFSVQRSDQAKNAGN